MERQKKEKCMISVMTVEIEDDIIFADFSEEDQDRLPQLLQKKVTLPRCNFCDLCNRYSRAITISNNDVEYYCLIKEDRVEKTRCLNY